MPRRPGASSSASRSSALRICTSLDLAGVDQLADRDRVGCEKEQRLDHARELRCAAVPPAHLAAPPAAPSARRAVGRPAVISIGPKFSPCDQVASPFLWSSSRAKIVTA